jgi:hypothetical protein
MTLSDIGKSLSNYNRCVTMKIESKIKNYYLDLMKNNNNKLGDKFGTNKSNTKQIESHSNLNDISNRNNMIKNNFVNFSSIDIKNNFLSIENSNNGKNSYLNILDSDNSILKTKNNFKISENNINKISNKDSELTISSKSVSSSNNNLNYLAIINNNNNINSNNNTSILEYNNNSLEFNNNENKNDIKKTENSNYENYFKGINYPKNILKQFSKEKNLRQNKNSNKELINTNKNTFVKNSSKSITDFEFAFVKTRKMKIDETERVQDTNHYKNSNVNSAVSDRNHISNIRNKNINELNENTLITSVSSMGGLNTIESNNLNYKNKFLSGNVNNKIEIEENDVINLLNNFNNRNIPFDFNQLKKFKNEKDQTNIKKENKKSIIDDSILKNFKSSNHNSRDNFMSSAKKKSSDNKFKNSNNFKYLNDLLNHNLNSINDNNNAKAENEKPYGFFSAEKNKLSHLNPELYIKTRKSNAPSFEYISGLSKNEKANQKENSMNPALRKINDLKNELSFYIKSTTSKNSNNNNITRNISSNNFVDPSNVDLGNLISSTPNCHLSNSNFNFNFNFFNGPNLNPIHHSQNISYNYLSNLRALKNNNNIKPDDNNINLLMRILDNKTVDNSNADNLKLGNLKNNNNGNKYKFLNLNNLTYNDSSFINNNNINFNVKSSKNKNSNIQKNNKYNFNNLLDYPITTKNKNINYFNFDENNKKRTFNK